MAIFAKLYERDGVQVLVTRQFRDEDDRPEMRFRFEHRGCWVEPAVAFADTEAGIELRDKAFDEMTEDRAFKMVATTTADLDAMIQEVG